VPQQTHNSSQGDAGYSGQQFNEGRVVMSTQSQSVGNGNTSGKYGNAPTA